MPRHWLLTSTFYGHWLPGDPRGFVARVRDHRAGDPDTHVRLEHDIPGTPYDEDLPALWQAAKDRMKGPPVCITVRHAEVLVAQFQETATYRRWKLLAAAVMSNHVHLAVVVTGDPEPADVLGDFKAYGSRALNRAFGKPAGGKWWTESGSKRKLPDDEAVRRGVYYVLHRQFSPLLVWPTAGETNHPGERGA